MNYLWHVFLNWTGASNTSGVIYGFWSGFGSDITEIAVLGTLVNLYKQHNCKIKGCPRIGHHAVEGTPYKTCHKHTIDSRHAKIKQDHSEKYPRQHKFLNKE